MVSRYVWASLAAVLTACSFDSSASTFAATGSAGAAPLSASDPSGLGVRVAQGELLGHVIGDVSMNTTVREFLGIPFAEPPVGALRWAAPQAKAAWPQPLVAQHFGPRCPQ